MISHSTALSFSYIFTGITLLILSILVLFKKNKSNTHYAFGFYSFAIAWWCLNNFFVINTSSKKIATLFNTSCLVGVIFIPLLFLYITYSICPRRKNRILLAFTQIISIIFLYLLFNNLGSLKN